MGPFDAIQGSEIVYRLGWTLLHTLWLGAVVAVALAVVLWALRRRSANARYVAACAALAMMVALPAATFCVVQVPVKAIERAPEAAETIGPIGPIGPIEEAGPALSSSLGAVPPGALPPSAPVPAAPAGPPLLERISQTLEPVLPWLVFGWALGVFALSLWQLAGWMAARRLMKLAHVPVDNDLPKAVARIALRLRLSRPVKVLESALVRVPSVVGWFWPAILLPAGLASGLTIQQLEAVLAHELAHIRRYDYLVNLLQSLVETLLFYHPAVWFISRRIRAERENCCDDIVVAAGAEPFSYAQSLLHIAQRSAGVRRLPASVALNAAGKPSQLRLRVGRLVGGSEETARLARSWPIAAVLLTTAIVAAAMLGNSKALPAAEQGGPTLGTVIERVIGTWEKLENCGLDLETGRLLSRPAGVRDTPGNNWAGEQQWWRENELDLRLPPGGGGDNKGMTFAFMLQGLDLAVIRAPEALWNGTAADIAALAQKADKGTSDGGDNGHLGDTVSAMLPLPKLPVYFAFRTRGGNLGILKIAEYVKEPRSVKVAYRMVNPAKPDDKSSFGPVIERVVHEEPKKGEGGGKDWLIDLDTGKLYGTPDQVYAKRDQQALEEWAREQGIDASGVKASQGILALLDCRATVIEGVEWDKVTLAHAEEALRVAHPLSKELTQMGGKDRPQSTVYAFQTRKGGVGVLQVTGVTDEGKGVKIRYKVKPGKDADQGLAKLEPMAYLKLAQAQLEKEVGGRWAIIKRERAPGLGPELVSGSFASHGVDVPYFILSFPIDEEALPKLKLFRVKCNAALVILGGNRNCTVLAGTSHDWDVSNKILKTLGLSKPPAKKLSYLSARTQARISGRVVDEKSNESIVGFKLQFGTVGNDGTVDWGSISEITHARDGAFDVSTDRDEGTRLLLRVMADGYLPTQATPTPLVVPVSARDIVVRLKPENKAAGATQVEVPLEAKAAHSSLKSQAIVARVAADLLAMKAQYPQLKEFGETNVSKGRWEEGKEPVFPKLSYRYGEKMPDRKAAYEKTSPDWCELWVEFDQVRETIFQREASPSRRYPKQGLTVWYQARSANDQLNKTALEIIEKALRPLDDEETRLSKAQTEAAWGDAVEGVQASVSVKKDVWEQGEMPVLNVQLRNGGQREFLGIWEGQRNCQVEVDDKWYVWPAALRWGVQRDAKPGQTLTIAPVTISPIWQVADEADLKPLGDRFGFTPKPAEHLQLSPGWHAVRVAFLVVPTRANTGNWLRVVSTPLMIHLNMASEPNRVNWPISVEAAEALAEVNTNFVAVAQTVGKDAEKTRAMSADLIPQAAKLEKLVAGTQLAEPAARFNGQLAALQQVASETAEERPKRLTAAWKALNELVSVATGDFGGAMGLNDVNAPPWGEAVGRLQAGLSLELGARPYRIGETVSFELKVRDVSDVDVELDYPKPAWLGSFPKVLDADGQKVNVMVPDIGMPVQVANDQVAKQTLKPGESLSLGSTALLLRGTAASRGDIAEPSMPAAPGNYKVSYDFSLLATRPDQPVKLLTTGEIELEVIAAEEEQRGAASPLKQIFHGLDLTAATNITRPSDLPDLWEERPEGSKSFELRKDLRTVYHELDGTVYYVPARNCFYVQWYPVGASTMRFYGPFAGDPNLVLKLGAAEEQPGAKSDAAFKATTASGVTIELLGVSRYPDKGQPWWLPDGRPMAEPPYDPSDSDFTSFQSEELRKMQFAFRIGGATGGLGQDASVKRVDGEGVWWGGMRHKGSIDLGNVRAVATMVPANQEALSIRLQIAAGEWQELGKADGKALANGKPVDSGKVQFSLKQADDKLTFITARLDARQRPEEVRLIAVDADKKVHVGAMEQWTPAPFDTAFGKVPRVESVWRFSDLPLARIQSVSLQSRPYETIVLSNVSLWPGLKTDARVMAEPARTEP